MEFSFNELVLKLLLNVFQYTVIEMRSILMTKSILTMNLGNGFVVSEKKLFL